MDYKTEWKIKKQKELIYIYLKNTWLNSQRHQKGICEVISDMPRSGDETTATAAAVAATAQLRVVIDGASEPSYDFCS